jgi:alkylated DNA nucleotide flippase Atl1
MRQAATAIASHRDPRQRLRRDSQSQRILDFLEKSGRAMTLGEIAQAIGVPDSTASARLNRMRPEIVDTYHDRVCSVSGNLRQTWYFRPKEPQRRLFGDLR